MSNLNGDTLISQKISEVQDIEHKLIPYSPQRNWKLRTPSIISWCLILPKECWKFRTTSISLYLILPSEYRKFGTTSISLHLILPSRMKFRLMGVRDIKRELIPYAPKKMLGQQHCAVTECSHRHIHCFFITNKVVCKKRQGSLDSIDALLRTIL